MTELSVPQFWRISFWKDTAFFFPLEWGETMSRSLRPLACWKPFEIILRNSAKWDEGEEGVGEDRYHEPLSCRYRSHFKMPCPGYLALGLLEPLLHDTIEQLPYDPVFIGIIFYLPKVEEDLQRNIFCPLCAEKSTTHPMFLLWKGVFVLVRLLSKERQVVPNPTAWVWSKRALWWKQRPDPANFSVLWPSSVHSAVCMPFFTPTFK